MKSKHIKRKPTRSQDLSHGVSKQADVTASGQVNAQANRWVANQPIKRVSPMTFSQKMYQPSLCEIAAESQQALKANSLEEVRKLLEKVIELGN
ncbi:MAG: hypothetical protein JO235_24930 [Chroococcidiopsidaceae cyanobacterium CP_BM_RX_35]|nr:hypothetical protein [Chroococcidiopsidaceae cyanobacterium CP_BM_RX_35]